MLEEMLSCLFEQDPASSGAASRDSEVEQAVDALKVAKQAADDVTRQQTIKKLRTMHGGRFETIANNEIDYSFKKAARTGRYFNQKDLQKAHDNFWDWVADHIETFDAGKGTFQNWIKYLSSLFSSQDTKARKIVAPGMGRPASTKELDPEKYDLPKMEPYTDDERVVASVIHNYLSAVSKGSKPFPYAMKNATPEKGKALVDIFLSYWGIGTPRVNGMALVSKYPELVASRATLRQLMQTMALAIEKYVQKETARLGVSDPSGSFKGLLQKLSPLALGGLSKADPSIVAETATRMDDLLADLLSVYKAA